MARIVSSGKALHSPEYHVRRENERRIKLRWMAVLLVLFVILPVLALRHSKLLIGEIVVDGAHATQEEEIVASADSTLRGNYFWILPKRSVIFYPRKSLLANITTEIPRVKELNLELRDLNTLIVSIEERFPLGLYCPDYKEFILTECYFIDEEGLMFARAPHFSGDVYFIYSRLVSGEPLGQQFMPSEDFKKVANFIEEANLLSVDAKVLEVEPAVGDKTKYKLILAGGGYITWDSSEDMEHLLSNLKTFLLSNIVTSDPAFLDKVLYIDLSIDNKVFYKFK